MATMDETEAWASTPALTPQVVSGFSVAVSAEKSESDTSAPPFTLRMFVDQFLGGVSGTTKELVEKTAEILGWTVESAGMDGDAQTLLNTVTPPERDILDTDLARLTLFFKYKLSFTIPRGNLANFQPSLKPIQTARPEECIVVDFKDQLLQAGGDKRVETRDVSFEV